MVFFVGVSAGYSKCVIVQNVCLKKKKKKSCVVFTLKQEIKDCPRLSAVFFDDFVCKRLVHDWSRMR